MGLFAKLFLGIAAVGALGSVWFTMAGRGAHSMRGAAYYRPSVRSGSVGHGRVYYYGGKY